MRQRLTTILFGLLFLAGFLVLCYPTISDQWNTYRQNRLITSYETVFPFTSDLIVQQEAVLALYKVGRNHCTGSDAEFQYVRVELWDKAENKENEFAARLFIVSAEISSISGEDEIAVSGNLNAVGDPIDGTFNTTTKTFTPLNAGTAAPESGA